MSKKHVTEKKTSSKNASEEDYKNRISREPLPNKKTVPKETKIMTSLNKKMISDTKLSGKSKVVASNSAKSPYASKIVMKKQIDTPKNSSTSITSKINRKKPPTPPSNRVTKTQFFPGKPIPSKPTQQEILKSKHSSAPKIQAKRIKDNQKGETSKSSNESKEILERPRTATLKKGLIVNDDFIKNINNETESSKNSEHEEDDYEDDFDSYDSDFEAYTASPSSSSSTSLRDNICDTDPSSSSSSLSTEEPKRVAKEPISNIDEERKLDSGTFDLPEQKHKHILNNIQEILQEDTLRVNSSNLASLSDEGFEDARSSHFENNDFFNFATAKEKAKLRKVSATRRKRGEEIMNMIKLDKYSFTLFDLPSIPYEKFIQIYGNRNGLQVSSQTGEDNVNEEIQTDEILLMNKWNQMPVRFSRIDENNHQYMELYKQEFLGVGGDIQTTKEESTERKSNFAKLNRFLKSAGNLMSDLLKENHSDSLNDIQNSNVKAFSDGFIEFNTTCKFLNGTHVVYISCKEYSNSQILTVHRRYSNNEEVITQSFVCMWYMSEPNNPEYILNSYGEVSCCCFGFEDSNFVFGGLMDGSLNVWDVNRDYDNDLQCSEASLYGKFQKTPTYLSEIGQSHFCNVVTIKIVPSIRENFMGYEKSLYGDNLNEICTLDEEGCVIFWAIIIKTNWEKGSRQVLLVQNKKLLLNANEPKQQNIKCTDMLISSNNFYVSTTSGYIMHTNLSGVKSNPKKYVTHIPSSAECLVACPFSEKYFLVGFQDGNVGLFSKYTEKPLMIMANIENVASVKQLQWSFHKPSIFYSISTRSIDIWDFASSDMFPVYSVPFQENITYVKLIPPTKDDTVAKKSFMMIGTSTGSLNVHVLSKHHSRTPLQEYEENKKKFLNYVNRL